MANLFVPKQHPTTVAFDDRSAEMKAVPSWVVKHYGRAPLYCAVERKGLVHLLDEIQDQAAERIGPHVVFGEGEAPVQKPDNKPLCDGCQKDSDHWLEDTWECPVCGCTSEDKL